MCASTSPSVLRIGICPAVAVYWSCLPPSLMVCFVVTGLAAASSGLSVFFSAGAVGALVGAFGSWAADSVMSTMDAKKKPSRRGMRCSYAQEAGAEVVTIIWHLCA